MAHIRIKIANNEIEIDSRDFYLDNQSIEKIILEISKHLNDSVRMASESKSVTKNSTNILQADLDCLNSIDNVEVHEPEFSPPVSIYGNEIRQKLEILEKSSFFHTPRSVSETVEQLREYGWIASPLEISKILTNMAFHKELTKNSKNNLNYYSTTHIITN